MRSVGASVRPSGIDSEGEDPQREDSLERHERGVTLLEILVVVGIIGIMMGFGVGALQRQQNDLEQTAVTLRDLVRLARGNARFYQSTARLVVDPPPRTTPATQGELDYPEQQWFRVLAVRPLSEWNFDLNGPSGSFGIEGTLGAASIVDAGRFGKGLEPDPEGGQPGVFVRTSQYSEFDMSEGFVARLDLWLDAREACTILRLGQSFELGIDNGGFARGQVTFTQSGGQAGRTIRMRGLQRLPLRQWFRLSLAYDGKSIVLERDGLEEDERPGDGRVFYDRQGEFWISAGDTPVPGRIDSVELFGYERLGEFQLPQDVRLLSGAGDLHFASDGRLDPRYHGAPVTYRMAMGEAQGEEQRGRESVTIELGGLPR